MSLQCKPTRCGTFTYMISSAIAEGIVAQYPTIAVTHLESGWQFPDTPDGKSYTIKIMGEPSEYGQFGCQCQMLIRIDGCILTQEFYSGVWGPKKVVKTYDVGDPKSLACVIDGVTRVRKFYECRGFFEKVKISKYERQRRRELARKAMNGRRS